jgi:hypothetical protein
MKRNLFYLLTICLFISCQKEDLITTNTQSNSLEKAEVLKPEINLHPSVLNSDWYSKMHKTTQQFVALEMSQSSTPITLKQIQERRKNAYTLSEKKMKICPNYPDSNTNGDVTLSSQADVDAFGALKCKEIVGAFVVVDTLGPDPICSLQPLKGIKEVGSSMTIFSNCLSSLDGLDKLKSIGQLGPFGFIGINGDNLIDIEALSNLSTLTGSLNIIGCASLTTMTTAFQNITTIESGKTSAPLTSIYVVNSNDNDALSDLSGFSNLTHIEGGLRIIENTSLLDLDDFSGLNTVGADIFIIENTSLLNINELSNISSISNNLLIWDNESLIQCCGLYNLICSDAPTCSSSGVGGNVVMINNGAGCTETDIIANGPCI